MIRPVVPGDASAICDIYNHYIENTVITFEEEKRHPVEFQSYIEQTIEKYPWFVYEERGQVLGYAYASGWKSRCAYRYSVETTVYLMPGSEGKGIGTQLYRQLIETLKQKSLHSLLAGIALPNDASVALHEKLGFEKVGQFKEVGRKFDRWIDVGYWELLTKS